MLLYASSSCVHFFGLVPKLLFSKKLLLSKIWLRHMLINLSILGATMLCYACSCVSQYLLGNLAGTVEMAVVKMFDEYTLRFISVVVGTCEQLH
jgi:hypothetical protein